MINIPDDPDEVDGPGGVVVTVDDTLNGDEEEVRRRAMTGGDVDEFKEERGPSDRG